MTAITPLSARVGVRAACSALNVHHASYYRHIGPRAERCRAEPALKLSAAEREAIHEMLVSARFVDQAPATIVATLIDEGVYLCSERTMYRILRAYHELKERRRGHRHVHYHKPELLARAANQIWSWDITVLKGPAPWQYHYLYVILDIFSRYVVGWMIAERESATLAKKLIKTTLNKHDIAKDQLTLHADRGASMKSKKVAQLLADLGVIKTHSRPHTSDDNPYSEAQFKTLKYRPSFPLRFNSIEDAERHCQTFFRWYNFEHKHSGIAMLTPHTVHHGLAKQTLAARHITMTEAYKQHPQRFKYRAPIISTVPDAVWINKPNPQPKDKHDTDQH